MNPTLPLNLNAVMQDDLIVLGFNNSFEDNLLNEIEISTNFNVQKFENSFKAFQHLESLINKGGIKQLPAAIICEFDSLKEENFLLLHDVLKHPVLKFIPFIAMNRDGLNHKMEALQLGFDDYYDVPVNSETLKERINFLSAFKRELETCEYEENEKCNVYISPLKRAFDILFASTLILLLLPLFGIVALMIWFESPGGVVYRSKRVGTGYHVFDFLKFRSMYKDADKRLEDLKDKNQYNGSEGGALFMKFNNDPRVTKVGRFIRKTSIDELPQLFNVLKGDMSVVGNRPLPMYEAEQLTRDTWAQRFLAPAGLTGLWQVTKRGKNDMDPEERIGLDIKYADKHSFWYDMKLILKTPFALIQEENV